ncbi:MAG: FixH family protein [Planctomycetes bacterium]|nr:FixH family protein [Planctomycetota bacterium]MCC7169607.1 FixH family protein [Planctomycetota bacterium]
MKPVVARRVWVGVVVGMLGFCITMQVILLVYATGDPSFTVERDYETKAAHWDDVLRQRADNDRLGWSADAELVAPTFRGEPAELKVVLKDRAGQSIGDAAITFEACAIARASHIATGEATPTSSGAYVAPLLEPRPGLWEVRLTAERMGQRFTATLRRELGAVGGG